MATNRLGMRFWLKMRRNSSANSRSFKKFKDMILFGFYVNVILDRSRYEAKTPIRKGFSLQWSLKANTALLLERGAH
ncbi:MAG: hypothetical protein M0036_16470 [Desulfobacteraceae bacterium]|nr:hypothetical protein [Desulfobacteraceae bacterium]